MDSEVDIVDLITDVETVGKFGVRDQHAEGKAIVTKSSSRLFRFQAKSVTNATELVTWLEIVKNKRNDATVVTMSVIRAENVIVRRIRSAATIVKKLDI